MPLTLPVRVVSPQGTAEKGTIIIDPRILSAIESVQDKFRANGLEEVVISNDNVLPYTDAYTFDAIEIHLNPSDPRAGALRMAIYELAETVSGFDGAANLVTSGNHYSIRMSKDAVTVQAA
ncbi:MAG: hypothetical protein J0M34_01680 [Alphaproteobacteria bacterium]|nr:hypothetical protein [Alphaproteobacteria bacterium]